MEQRPQPRSSAFDGRVFLTDQGRPLTTPQHDCLARAFRRLVHRLGLTRRGRNFYGLRRTFRTLADDHPDQHAIHRIMGHTFPGMSDIYVAEISIERLRAVVDHVRAKVFDG